MSSLHVRAAALLALGLATTAALGACGDDEGIGGAGPSGPTATSGTGGAPPSGVQIPGLSAPVQAVYDEFGILHLTCATDDDCFAALGYFHAQNRFFVMDFVRNVVRGRLAALVRAGQTVLASDFENRRYFATASGEPLEEKLYADASPAVRGHLDAYARGVNAWIGDMRAGRNGATLTTEYDFELVVKEAIRDWEPADSAAVGLYTLNDLSNNAPLEIAMAESIPAFDPALAADLFSARPVFSAYTAPPVMTASAPGPLSGGGLGAHAALVADARERLARVGSGAALRHPGETGSNNWVVAPSRTSGGSALLANDPHLLLSNPSIWFAVEIDAKSSGTGVYHVAGSSFPGLPAVLLGHNERIAWGATVAYYDLADAYVETLSQGGAAVEFNGGDVPIVEREFTFEDASTGVPVTQTFRWVPHHGPIVSEDMALGTALTIRWRGHEGGQDLDAFFALGRAASAEEARQGLEQANTVGQNFVVVDVGGNIGWFPFSRVPSRPWASQALPPWLPLPGDGSAEWGPPVAPADLPQLYNPPSGVIATANQDHNGSSEDGDITNDGLAALQTFAKADGTRQQRILDLLAAGGDAHDVATMTAIQGDSYSLYGEFVVPLVLSAAASGPPLAPEEQDVVDALTLWQFSCPTGLEGSDPVASPDAQGELLAAASIGCTAFHATFFAVVHAALADEYTAAGLDPAMDRWDLNLVARALKDPTTISSGDMLWDDVSTPANVESRDDVLRRGLSLAANRLAAMGEPNDWRWGRHHTLTLRSIYDNFGIPTYNAGPYAAPGALYTVNVANPYDDSLPPDGMPWDFAFAGGPSIRFVVEARSDRPYMTYQIPGGADLHRESPFYNNLLPRWLENEPIAFAFGPGAVTNPALTVEVTPAP